MLDKKVIGDRLRKLRGNRTLIEVATACNISPSALSMYENGERIPRDEIKLVLSKFYRKSVQSIFFAV
ncbi:helix-turn-helix domain-containing protein [uncultured Anaerovibrio sp.]|uniref:helix-turn-helix domain-containing protein n=1 Tax=uncultured Anaerovibrio sp. TaxID=361586 RepID=UPI0026260A23|nr:helix-turn-helix transcriptional regulator [uncultured Anaerovibrio sp.]